MKRIFPALANRSLALALALALLLSLCPVIPLTAKAAEHTGEWTYLVKGTEDYKWINGSFTAGDSDLVYEGDQPYDWTVTVQPSKTPPPSVNVSATITDSNGNQVSTYSGSVDLGKNALVTLCTSADFAGLTTSLSGSFKLTCDVIYNGTVYARLEQTFSRTGEGSEPEATTGSSVETTEATEPEGGEGETYKFTDCWTYAAGWDTRLEGSLVSTDSDLVFEAGQAVNWDIYLRQQLGTYDVVSHVTVSKDGSVVGSKVSKTTTTAKGENAKLFSVADYTHLTADMTGTFALHCDIEVGGKVYAQMDTTFTIEGEGGETPDEPDDPVIPPEQTVTTAKAYLDILQEVVLENITACDGFNFTSNAPFGVQTIKDASRDLVAWNLGPNVALQFTLSEAFLEGFDGNATVIVEYVESSNGGAQLVYHSAESTETVHTTVMAANNTNTFEVKKVTFELTDAVFTNLYGKGYSFAILGTTEPSGRFYLKSVTVQKPGAVEPGNTYTLDLTSASDVADLKFMDETPYDLTLNATTSGNLEVATATYSLTGGNLAEAVTGTKTVTLSKEGVNILDAAWFNENAQGFGEFTLEVTLSSEEATIASKTFSFSRDYTSILSSELTSATAENKDGVLVFEEDAAMDLELFLKNKLAVPFSGTLTYTVSHNGTALEGYNGLSLNIENLSGDASEVEGVLLPEATAYGIYELAISVTDAEGNEVHTNTFSFARAKAEFINATVSSETAGEEMVFVDEAPYDLVLDLQKADGFGETLTISYEILKGEEVVKTGSFEEVVGAVAAYSLRAIPSTQIDLAEILADVEGYGEFTLKLKITNSLGYENEYSYKFSRVESIKVTLTSPTRENLVFKDDEAYDLQLNLQQLIGDEAVYSINYMVYRGEYLVDMGFFSDVSVTNEVMAQPLDLSGVTGNGVFVINVTLTDGEGNTVKTVSFEFVRTSSIDAAVVFQGNEEGIELPTFIDLVNIEAAVAMKKPVGEAEAMTVNYVVTDKDGNEVATGTTTQNVGTTTAYAIMDMSAVTEFGTYTVTATVLDAASNEVATVSAEFARVEYITTKLVSASNPDLIFTEGEAFDLGMGIYNSNPNGVEALKVTYTISGEGMEDITLPVTSLNATKIEKYINDLTSLAGMPATGTFTLTLLIGDAQNRVRVQKEYTFSRVALVGSVEAAIKSPTTADLVYGVGADLDMQLYVQKTDNIPEGFDALLIVTDSQGNELGKVEAPLNPFLSRRFALKELVDLSAAASAGAYDVYVKLTDNSGNVRFESTTTFTVISLEGSVEAAVTSESNPDLIFTEGEEFDLVLHMRKTDGVAEQFKAVITLTDKDGNLLKEKEANVPATLSMKTALSNLIDLSDLPTTGSYILNVVLTDAAGNERLTLTKDFHRVKLASVKTQVSSPTNKDMIFIDADTVDLVMYAQKTDSVAEELILYYSVLNPEGEEIATNEGKTVVPAAPSYFKIPIELAPEAVSTHGTYKVIMMVMDNNGNIRSETTTPFVRTSGSLKHQVSGSSTGTKMQFTPAMNIDLCLFIQKLDGVKETLKGNLVVTSPSGQVVYSISGNLNIQLAPSYFKFALPLTGKCTEFGVYKVSYTLYDDAGNLRASSVAQFKMISPTGDLAVAVQSASGKSGMIYTKDEPFDLVLYIQKADGVEQTLQVRYTISDMNGLVLETKQGNLSVPATGYRKIPIELPEDEAFQKYGVYTMKVEVAGPDGKLIYNESFSFSRVLVPEKQLSIMGVCTHLSKRGMTVKQSQQYVDLARQSGISFWRDELPWSTVEPSKGTYYFPSSADAAVDYTQSIGLEPLLILDYGNDNYGSDVTTDEWLEGYLGYVRAMVTHFKGRVMYYEVWNEWNIGLGGMDKKYRDMADVYAKLLVETYKVIKEIDPEITVIGGVVAGGEEEWTEKMLQYPGAIDSMDVFSYHEYPDNDVREFVQQAETVRELLTKYGRPDLPMWVTETGFPTHIGRASFSDETSAGNLVSLYTWAIANPDVIDMIFWYDLHNDGVERENAEHNFGLLRTWDTEEENVPMAAKPSYVALCAMNSILCDAEYVGEYDMGHRKITAYHFKKDGKDLLITWADNAALNMVATVGENNIIVTDMYGNASALEPVDGKVSLFFSDAPVYIEYDLSQTLDMVEGGFTLDQEQYSATPGAVFPVKITRNNGLETQSGSYVFSMPESWSVEGVEFGAAEAGATEIVDTVYITVGDDASKGEMTVTARVVIGSNVVGQFNVPIEMGDICTVNPDVVFTENGAEFKISVQVLNENSTKPLAGTINLLAPEALVGDTESIAFEIPAGENQAVLIDVPADYANTYHTVKVEVVLGSGAKHEVTKPMGFLYAIEAPEGMKLDGVIDEQWEGAMEFSMGEDDWCNTTDSDAPWHGNTAKGYAMWDDQYLYVAVEAYDASHYQVGTGASIWMGDSIQLTTDVSRFTVPAYYGYNEVGFSLNSENGSIENWNWFAAAGKNVSEGGIFKIVRDDATETTTYEVALPWSELLPKEIEFGFRSLGFALIVNENSIDEDGEVTGRTGWIEYMSGIGLRKEPEKFGDLILVKRSEIQ